jgi:UrcA family protein
MALPIRSGRNLGMALASMASIFWTSAACAAQPRSDAVHVVVGDLDFSSARDVARFASRVDTAARSLCRQQSQLDFLETGACYRWVRAQFVRQLSDAQRRQLLAASRRSDVDRP